MPVTVDFYYDLVSPNTYMANQVVPDLAKRTGAHFNYIPVLLGGIMRATGNTPPFILHAPVKEQMAYGALELERFVKKHALRNYKFNTHFPLNALLMMRGAIAAEHQGKLLEYLKAGERLVWEQGLKMDDPEVFLAGFTAQGLNGAELLESTQDSEVKHGLIANTEAAVARGVFGVPTFFVGDEMYFGKDRLRDLEEEIVARS
ncbi:MAG: 2-hydroxychromene-2-carboxylate isomerase [Pseudomonadota bacterium]